MLNDDTGRTSGPGHWFEQDRRHMRIGFGWPLADELESGLAAISARCGRAHALRGRHEHRDDLRRGPPPRHTSDQFMGADGVRLLLHAWLPSDRTRGAAAGGDGRCRRGSRVRRPRRPLHLARRGHGRAWLGGLRVRPARPWALVGPRGQVRRFDGTAWTTPTCSSPWCGGLQPGTPVFLLGHSLGGLDLRACAEVRPPRTSPALSPLVALPPAWPSRCRRPGRRRQAAPAKVSPDRDIGDPCGPLSSRTTRAVVDAYVTDRTRPSRGAGALGGRPC